MWLRRHRASLRPCSWNHSDAPAVWTSVNARLCTDFDPRPAGDAALLAGPLLALELARRRRHIKMALGLSHFSCAGVPRNFERGAGAFAVHTAGPRTRQVAVLVTMLGADFHDRATPARAPHHSWCLRRPRLRPTILRRRPRQRAPALAFTPRRAGSICCL